MLGDFSEDFIRKGGGISRKVQSINELQENLSKDIQTFKGKSGSGKSSFMLLMLGLLNSTQGEIEINSIKNKKQTRQKLDSNNLINHRLSP